MAELLIRTSDNFPHKDYMLSMKTTDLTAKAEWIEREAQKFEWVSTYDEKILKAIQRWEDGCRASRHFVVVKKY